MLREGEAGTDYSRMENEGEVRGMKKAKDHKCGSGIFGCVSVSFSGESSGFLADSVSCQPCDWALLFCGFFFFFFFGPCFTSKETFVC